MADIDIEKKNKNNNSVWAWIIGILVIAGVIWWVAAAGDEEEIEEAPVVEQSVSSLYGVDFPEVEPNRNSVILKIA